jgi:hypothetical protein
MVIEGKRKQDNAKRIENYFAQKANLTTDEHRWHRVQIQNGLIEAFLIRVNQCYQCYPW